MYNCVQFFEELDSHSNFHTNLHSEPQDRRVPLSLHTHQHLWFSVLLMIAILTQVRWNLNLVLIFISLMTKDFEFFFMCWFTTCTSFENSLLNLFVYLLIYWFTGYLFGWLVDWLDGLEFWVLNFWSSLDILGLNHLLEEWLDVLPTSKLSLHCICCFLCCTETLWFNIVPFIDSCCYYISCAFWVLFWIFYLCLWLQMSPYIFFQEFQNLKFPVKCLSFWSFFFYFRTN